MADSHDRRLDLTEDEERALIALLRQTLNTRYPPGLNLLKSRLGKLDQPKPAFVPKPPLPPGMAPSHGRGR